MEGEDKDVCFIRDLASRLGERYGDYVVLVRTKDSVIWKHSDQTWGTGACYRYLDIMHGPVCEHQEAE